jgi:hypothetical protein
MPLMKIVNEPFLLSELALAWVPKASAAKLGRNDAIFMPFESCSSLSDLGDVLSRIE